MGLPVLRYLGLEVALLNLLNLATSVSLLGSGFLSLVPVFSVFFTTLARREREFLLMEYFIGFCLL